MHVASMCKTRESHSFNSSVMRRARYLPKPPVRPVCIHLNAGKLFICLNRKAVLRDAQNIFFGRAGIEHCLLAARPRLPTRTGDNTTAEILTAGSRCGSCSGGRDHCLDFPANLFQQVYIGATHDQSRAVAPVVVERIAADLHIGIVLLQLA